MILIAGPPCGGKSTYAQSLAEDGELILNFDDLVEQITGDRFCRTADVVAEARELWNERLPAADYVIWTAPRRAQRGRFRSQHGAEVHVVVATREECLRRAAGQRPPEWSDFIRDWFAQWEPSRSGGELIVNTTPTSR